MAAPATATQLRKALPGLGIILRRFRHDIARQWALISSGFLGLLAEVAFRLLEPWPLAFILDRVIQPGAPEPVGIPWIDALDPLSLLTLAAVGIVVLTGARAGAAYLSTITFSLAGNRILTDVRARLYRHLQRLDLNFHGAARGGDLLTRLTGDIGRLQEVTVTAALPLVGNFVTLVAMVGVMVWLNVPLALIALAALPIFLLTTGRLTKRIGEVSRKQRAIEGALASVAAESLGAIKVVQSYSLETTMEDQFQSANAKSLKDGVKAKKLAAGLERKTDLLVAVATGLVLFVGARQVLSGRLSPGELIVFVTYLKNAFKPMRDVAKYVGRLAKAAASGERIVAVLDTLSDVADAPDAVVAPGFAGHVELARLWFSYGDREPVLRGLDLTVEPGQRVALVGPSGAGKSSLVSLLLRLYDPSAGCVKVDGRDVREYTLASLRRQIAIVLQDSVLFATTIRDNIAYGRPDASDPSIIHAARLANAHDFITALPDGYDTVIGERGATLSGGQRQRIAIARAAVREATIVVLDEPTSGLDGRNEQEVVEALDRLTAGRTTFLITHELRTVTGADRILWLERGEVVEAGTHAELLAHDGRYAWTYRLQERTRTDVVELRTQGSVRDARVG